MNRVVTASLISVIILVTALGALLYFRKIDKAKDKTFSAIPADAACIMRGHLTPSEIKQLLGSPFIKNFVSLPAVQGVETRLNKLLLLQNSNTDVANFFQNNLLTLSIHPTKVNAYDFIFYADNVGFAGSTFFTQKVTALYDSVINENVRTYVGEKVYDLNLKNGGIFSYTIINDLLIASSTPFLVEDAMRQLKAGKAFENANDLEKTAIDKNLGFKIYINYHNLPKWINVFCNPAQNIDFSNIKNFATWSYLDLSFNQNQITCNGNTLSDTGSFLSTLTGQNAKAVKVLDVMPDNVAMLKSYMISNVALHFDKLKNNKTLFTNQRPSANNTLQTLQGLIVDEYGLLITEPASTNYQKNTFAYFLTHNAKASLKLLGATVAKTSNDSYRSHSIITLPDNFLPNGLGSTFEHIEKSIATHIGDFIFIANNKEQLKVLIDSYENKSTWKNLPLSKELLTQFAAVGNFFCYVNIPRCHYLLQDKANNGASSWLTQNKTIASLFDSYAFCIKQVNNQFETTAYLHTINKAQAQANVLWSQTLDAPALFEPQLIAANDSVTYIAVQDTLNQLYLYDNAGVLKWKQSLTEKIIGNISSIDAYKNGSRYLVFATSNYWFLMHINGTKVSNFPIKLPASTTAGLSAFDIDQTGDYRMYVPCANGTIYGYNTSGKPIFNFNASYNAPIIQPLQYFKMANDILLGITDNQHAIGLERNGKISFDITLPETLPLPLALNYNNYKIQFIDKAGTEISIDSVGNMEPLTVDYQNMNTILLNDSSQIQFYLYQNYCTVTKNNKTLFNYNVTDTLHHQLKYSFEDGQPLFLLQNKALSKTYVLQTNGTLMHGFPISGHLRSKLCSLNGDNELRLVLLTDTNVLSVYSLK
jgi:hypothetical protein